MPKKSVSSAGGSSKSANGGGSGSGSGSAGGGGGGGGGDENVKVAVRVRPMNEVFFLFQFLALLSILKRPSHFSSDHFLITQAGLLNGNFNFSQLKP